MFYCNAHAQQCKNKSVYYYGDTVTVCGRVSHAIATVIKSAAKDSTGENKYFIPEDKVTKESQFWMNLQLPISVVNRKIERDPKKDISENHIQEFEIIDTKNLLSKELKGEPKELRGVFHHRDPSSFSYYKVWLDLIEVK
jgi:hypothetical protein